MSQSLLGHGSSGVNYSNKPSSPSFDDIPEARREVLIGKKAQAPQRPWVWLGLLALLCLLAGGGLAWVLARARTAKAEPSSSALAAPSQSNVSATSSAPVSTTTSTATASPSASPSEGTLLGHHQFAVANPAQLVPLSQNTAIKLKPAAAQKLNEMIRQAQADGVQIQVISGYRSLEDQQFLFFEVKAERGETPTKRAEVSAPPGYSEHHTGYAIDLGDATNPSTDLENTFEQTKAFVWLKANAARYGFEMSFPKDNAQGVSYEPWHWRFVGDQDSLETFYKK
jgi:zinc D-Ala-D-Ala carboxypeptidase